MTKRRPHRHMPLSTPALARPHRLGNAVAMALGQAQGGAGMTAPAMGMGTRSGFGQRKLSHGNDWGPASTWQHGRALNAPKLASGASWGYSNFSNMGTAVAHQGGIALVELMLVIGIIAVATGVVVQTYKVTDNNRKVNEEVDHATTIAQNMVSTTVTGGDFSQMNQANALRDGIFPEDMLDSAGNPHSVWGGDVLVTASNIDGKANWGSVLTFEGVPAVACSKLVSQASTGFYAVAINNQTVRTNYGPLDMAAVSSLCMDGNARVQFTYAKHGGAGVGQPDLTPCSVPAPNTDTVIDSACPAGQLGTVVYRTDHTCPAPYGPSSDLPAVQISSTCTPACVLPVPSTQTSTDTQTNTQTLGCPPGQGPGAITQTRTEQRQQSRDATCPASPDYSGPVGPYAWSPPSPWTPWVATTPWTTTSNTCAPTCSAPPPTPATPQNRAGTCDPGRVKSNGTTNFLQTRTGVINYTCATPTSPVSSSTTWADWTPSEASVCAPQCVAPPPGTDSRAGTPATRSQSCPAGQSGTISQSQSVTDYRTVAYSCSTPTGTATPSYGAWGTPPPAYGDWTTTSNTCSPSCVAPPSTTQSANQTVSCTSGRLTPAGSSTFTQTQTRAVNYACPPTGAYTTSYGPWSAWSPTEASACAAQCVAPPSADTPESQTASCPAGQTTSGGSSTFTQNRVRSNTYSCPSPTGAYTSNPATYTAWLPNASSVCAAPQCTAPPPVIEDRAGTPATLSQGCPGGQPGTFVQTRTVTEHRTVTYSCAAPTSPVSTNYTPWGDPAPTYGPWTVTSNTCPSTTCVAPADQSTPESQTTACPAGKVTSAGDTSFTQNRVRTDTYSCPTPSGPYTQNPATYTPWTPLAVTTCKTQCTPPAPQTQWVPTSDTACPAGTSGTRNYQIQQQQDGTCAAPWGPAGYGGWYNTGATQNMDLSGCAPIGNNCVVPSTPISPRTWGTSPTCTAVLPAGTYAHASNVHVVKNNPSLQGEADFVCNNGVVATTANPGAYCISK